MVKRNVQPLPFSDSTQMRPLRFSTGTSTLKKELQVILKGEQANSQPIATRGIGWQDASSAGLNAASIVDRALRALLTISDAPLSLDQALPKLHQGSVPWNKP
jgi:hypothetical protein